MARPYAAPAIVALVLLVFVGLAIPPASGAAAVAWSPSTSLLISEVQTGGLSASDEFVELYNAAAQPVDLTGLEVAYASATGGTVTRKAAWD
ncbi:MAG: lamin tail domain-containing protein, partial [Chloroflexota bacterium]